MKKSTAANKINVTSISLNTENIKVKPEQSTTTKTQAETEEEYQQRLARAESALTQWIAFRREWINKPSRRGE